MLYSFTVENLIVFSYRLFILGATGLLVAGCGGGDPGVSYRGISAENAITLLSKAEGQEEQLAVLKAVESDAQFGFDWLYFWESVRNQNLEAGLEAAADDFLFHLGEKFCESTSFDAYAQVVLRRPSHYPRIVQPSRSCSFALNADTLMKYFTVLSSGEISEELGDRYLVELLSSYSQKVPSHQMQEILNQRTERQWAELLHRLVHGEQADLALQLLSVHQKIFGVVHFLELMTAPILASPQLLEKFTEALGLNFVLRLLTTSPERVSVVPEILQAHWESSMAYLARVYAASPPPSEEDMSWDTYLAELYAQYKSTALLLNHLRLKVPASFLLQIEEVLLRKLEAALGSNDKAARTFFSSAKVI